MHRTAERAGSRRIAHAVRSVGHPRRGRAGHPVLRALVVLSTVGLLLTGCGHPGSLHSAGATPTAIAPAQLWPDAPSAPAPAPDYNGIRPEAVEGVAVPGGNLHAVNPVDIVKAQLAHHSDTFDDPLAMYDATARAIDACTGAGVGACPVRKAYYRDLTGDGGDDLVVGIGMPEHQLAVRVYALQHGKLEMIMHQFGIIVSVQLAGRDVAIHSRDGLPGFEQHTVWSWDAQRRAMLITRDDSVRTARPTPHLDAPTRSLTPAAAPFSGGVCDPFDSCPQDTP
ncbi:hypothetical protein [Streptomyces sp. HUAS TT7]|uniref:hypothetical protein n=1 Tax=Streptomyces sp. HUAS TT7 TaxID=3447507 RepID=UPI003F65F9DF